MNRVSMVPRARLISMVCALGFLFLGAMSPEAWALPLFARQTGQNCVACHAGGQFPELTPYGRMFKMTGYTIGSRTIPFSVMGVASCSEVKNTRKSVNPRQEFQKNGQPIFATGSVFAGGKITDNIGAFIQATYDNFYTSPNAAANDFEGHFSADNMDIRYADHLIGPKGDLIFGISLNNNPSVADPWNTAPAWNQYVPVPSPTSSQFIDGNAPFSGYAAGGNIAGVTGYLYWDQLLYAEIGGYKTADDLLSFMSAGVDKADKTRLKGTNGYWRVALTKDWGPHNIMVGASGMQADVYDDPVDPEPWMVHHFKDIGADAQYQYILDPHTVTAQITFMKDKHRYPSSMGDQPSGFFNIFGLQLPDSSDVDTTRTLRAKLTYTYLAKFGGSFSYFRLDGNRNTANQTAGFVDNMRTFAPDRSVTGSLTGDPSVSGWTSELFWIPIQYVRVGLQYTTYDTYNGRATNYNGARRNASDNDTAFLYVWAAY